MAGVTAERSAGDADRRFDHVPTSEMRSRLEHATRPEGGWGARQAAWRPATRGSDPPTPMNAFHEGPRPIVLGFDEDMRRSLAQGVAEPLAKHPSPKFDPSGSAILT